MTTSEARGSDDVTRIEVRVITQDRQLHRAILLDVFGLHGKTAKLPEGATLTQKPTIQYKDWARPELLLAILSIPAGVPVKPHIDLAVGEVSRKSGEADH